MQHQSLRIIMDNFKKKFIALTKNKLLQKIAFLLCLWVILHIIIITIDGLWDEVGPADVGVVLGNKIEEDGQPSKRLQSRLDKAVALYQQGYFKQIIVSGGLGKEGFDEAVVMKKYLVDHQIPSEIITVDSQGLNTALTAQNAKKFLDQQNLKSALVISNYYHISRTKLAFAKVGINSIYSAHSDFGPELREPYTLLREFAGFYSYLFQNFNPN